MKSLASTDKQVSDFIQSEESRLKSQLQMIPSENIVSQSVLDAVGSVVINKYSEGQVGKRYYQGNINIDGIEKLAKDRALELFGLDSNDWNVNVQAVSGSIANLAVYSALLNVGDKMLGMFLYDGGHLSHGWKLPKSGKPISYTAKVYDPYYYYVDIETGVFDYDKVAKRAQEVHPKIIISGGTAYPRELNYSKLRAIADSVDAIYLADIAHEAGLVSAGILDSPFDYADVVTMTTRKTLRGPVGSIIFSRVKFEDKIDRSVMPGLQGGPMNNNIAGIAVALKEAMQPEFKVYASQIINNAQVLSEALITFGYKVVSGGTDKHLLLLDLVETGLNGHDAAMALEKADIIMNKNTVPGEKRKPWKPSGLRMGTPALTTRGMKESDMVKIAGWIHRALQSQMSNTSSNDMLSKIGKEVREFSEEFPSSF